MLAGSAWRAANDAAGGEDDESASMAFVLLNKLLDIYDAMEEAASGGDPAIEMADFTETDLPQEVPLPTESYLDADAVERVRDWVLEKSMEQRVEQVREKEWVCGCGCVCAARVWHHSPPPAHHPSGPSHPHLRPLLHRHLQGLTDLPRMQGRQSPVLRVGVPCRGQARVHG